MTETSKPRIVVVVEGGNVQQVLSDQPIDVVIMDNDNAYTAELGDPGIAEVNEGDQVWFSAPDSADLDPGLVQTYFDFAEQVNRLRRAGQP